MRHAVPVNAGAVVGCGVVVVAAAAAAAPAAAAAARGRVRGGEGGYGVTD